MKKIKKMHNIKSIRKDPDYFHKKIDERNIKINLKNLLDLDIKNRELIQNKEKLEQEKKIISKKNDKKEFARSKEISTLIDEYDKSLHRIQTEIDIILTSLPNLALDDVPIGIDQTEQGVPNVLIRVCRCLVCCGCGVCESLVAFRFQNGCLLHYS